MISANLLGKCLLIGGAGAATGTGAYYIKEIYFSNNKELKELAEKAGLSCLGKPTETFGVECKKLGSGAVKAKKDTDLDVSDISGGKIKVYLKSKSEEYNKDFKFVIEDGDVTTNDTSKKLEQFETYEIKDENNNNNWRLTKKTDAKAEIKKALGLPSETTCDLPTNEEKTCNLDEGKLKAINFEGKTKEMAVVNPAAAAAASADGLSLKMKVVAATDAENSIFPHGYKFTLVSNRDITLGGGKSIKKDTNTEFKIKVTPASGGPKVLTLEKAWNVTELGKLVGLNCPSVDKKECTLNADKINVNNNGANESNKKHSELTRKANTENKVVKYEIDHDGHSQGFKFFTEETNGIELEGGTSGSDAGSKKIEAKGSGTGTFYEIKKDGDKWYLTKKTASGGA